MDNRRLNDDLIKINKYLESTNDMDVRLALVRLIEIIEAWRSKK